MKTHIKLGNSHVAVEVIKHKNSPVNIILVHGISNNMNDPLISLIFKSLKNKHSILRFNFSFTNKKVEPEEKRNLAEIKAVMNYFNNDNLVIIGKSYGGYLSVFLAKKNTGIKKIITLGYPLYHKNNPKKMFPQAHLKQAKIPVIFILGRHDDRCDIKTFKKKFPELKAYLLKNANHSLLASDGNISEENSKKIISIINNEIDILSIS